MADAAPDGLGLPTGLGKTSVMAIWLIARAAGGPVPRRLVYVVDRRAVVDQATNLADQFAERLGPNLEALSDVSSAQAKTLNTLRENLGLSGEDPLAVSTLRGQYADNQTWRRDLSKPAIIVGTVDMIGSRLLFSGYLVSRWMRPVHAALLGMDSLIVLDESHLVPPFAHMLAALRNEAQPGTEDLPVRPFKLLNLSATRVAGGNLMGLEQEDRESAWTARRLGAPKHLKLKDDVPSNKLVEVLTSRALELADNNKRVLVFCDLFDDAVKIVNLITKKMATTDKEKRKADKSHENGTYVAQLTGRIRVHDRQNLTDDLVYRRFSEGIGGEGPAFLVATSAGEVGVDLDADHMVCDLVSWERMVQRLGRVNRTGHKTPAQIDVFPVQHKYVADEVYNQRKAPFTHASWPSDENGNLDASPGRLAALVEDDEFALVAAAASTPEPYRPALTRPLLDGWAMTSVKEHAGRPDIWPWLRGWQDNTEPDVNVVWRQHLPEASRVSAYIEAARPHQLEVLTAPLSSVVAWLKKCLSEIKKENIEGPRTELKKHLARDDNVLAILVSREQNSVYSGIELKQRIENSKLLNSNDMLILDARFCGLSVLGTLDHKADYFPAIWDYISDENTNYQPSTEFDTGRVISKRFVQARITDLPDRGWKIGAYRANVDPDSEADDLMEFRVEDRIENGNRAVSTHAQTLDEHHEWTQAAALKLCTTIGIEGALQEAIITAAAHHDQGKDRVLWQQAMGAPTNDRPLAKTTGQLTGGGLGGYRHEFGSVRDVQITENIIKLEEGSRDLALHLIAAHHGRARPSIPAIDPACPPPINKTGSRKEIADASEIALRFDRLQAQFGHYGLAWLEAVMRTADWHASDKNDLRNSNDEK